MSPRTGRPKTEKPKTVKYSIRLDEETEKQLQEYCQINGITKGEAFRNGLKLLFSKVK